MKLAIVLCIAAAAALQGCGGGDEPKPAGNGPATQFPHHAAVGPPLHPGRCAPDLRTEGLDTPNVDTVSRTHWKLVRVGSCRVKARDRRPDVSFMDGWAGLPDDCNHQSGRFRADGKRFIVKAGETGSTLIHCGGDGPSGYLGSVKSWGIADNDELYLLDRDGFAIFVVRPIGGPGCVVDVPPNGRKLVAHGDEGCDTSAMSNDLRADA